MADSKKKTRSLEETFDRLEEVIGSMEDEDITLEKSFELYEEGVHLLSDCNDKIDAIEKKVLELSGDGSLSEFEEEE
jgi:exodeoxyribonuclease VII small subunit